MMKKKPRGPQRIVRTPENVERVKCTIVEFPVRSARIQSAAPRISHRTVGRILDDELHFHPHELAVIQELNVRVYPQRLHL